MSAPKVTRKTRNSRKHLTSDFDWEGLEGLDFPATVLQDKREDDLLPERHGMITQQGTTAKSLKFHPQRFAFPLPGDVLTTSDSLPLSSIVHMVRSSYGGCNNWHLKIEQFNSFECPKVVGFASTMLHNWFS